MEDEESENEVSTPAVSSSPLPSTAPALEIAQNRFSLVGVHGGLAPPNGGGLVCRREHGEVLCYFVACEQASGHLVRECTNKRLLVCYLCTYLSVKVDLSTPFFSHRLSMYVQALAVLEPSSRRQRLVPLHDLLYTNTPTPPPVANANDVSPVMALDRTSPLLAVGMGTRVAVLHVDALLRVEQDENVLVSVTSESPWLRLNPNSAEE